MNRSSESIDSTTRDYLLSLKQRGVSLGLDRMRGFLAALGNPQDRVPVVHVAGTNGKGSVAAMVESILRTAGWRTGLYTSPHLIRLGERIQVNREPLAPSELAAHVAEMRPVVAGLVEQSGAAARPSYFEFMTALAFSRFVRASCDIAVIEVGMGGRLDATNVVTPEVSVITSIGLDHTEFLGSTFAAIATEKAGIVKAGRPVVIGRLPPDAERVVRDVAGGLHAPIETVAQHFGDEVGHYPTTGLSGDFQRVNAATATLVARRLGARWKITPEAIAQGLEHVDWPGRWQRLTVGGRTVIVDASHNAEGAAALGRNLATLVAETGRRPIVIVGVLGAARAKPLLEVVARHASEIHLVMPHQPRASSHDELASLIPPSFNGGVVRTSIEAIFPSPQQCLPGRSTEDTVVVTGSIYLAGEALVRIDAARGPLESDLQDF